MAAVARTAHGDPGAPVVEVDLGPGVRAGFTTTGPADRFNLSTALGDDAGRVSRNRRLLEAWVGAPVTWVRQVHGAGVLVDGGSVPGRAPGAPSGARRPSPASGPVEADAVVAVGGARAAGVLVADCVPVLLADAGGEVVAAVHAGRRGLVAGVVGAAVREMVRCGARLAAVRAVVGPSVCGACYEVPTALQAEVEQAVPGTATTTSWGTPALDLPGGVRRQLLAAGVGRVDEVGSCTVTDLRFFSHRGASAPGSTRRAGRFAAVVAAVS